MSKEFTYHQRPPDNRKDFERNWDKAFTKEQVKEMTDKSAHYQGETTEQKQPSLKD